MGVELGLDSLVDEAWQDYQASVTDALEALEPGSTLWVWPDGHDPCGGGSPLVEVVRWRSAVLVVLDRRNGPEYWAKVPATGMHDVANLVVSGLRDAVGVLHPVFLEPLQVSRAA